MSQLTEPTQLELFEEYAAPREARPAVRASNMVPRRRDLRCRRCGARQKASGASNAAAPAAAPHLCPRCRRERQRQRDAAESLQAQSAPLHQACQALGQLSREELEALMILVEAAREDRSRLGSLGTQGNGEE